MKIKRQKSKQSLYHRLFSRRSRIFTIGLHTQNGSSVWARGLLVRRSGSIHTENIHNSTAILASQAGFKKILDVYCRTTHTHTHNCSHCCVCARGDLVWISGSSKVKIYTDNCRVVLVLRGNLWGNKTIHKHTSLYYLTTACVTGSVPQRHWSSDVGTVAFHRGKVLKEYIQYLCLYNEVYGIRW